MTGITQGAQIVSFSYDAAGRRTTKTLPNGTSETYGYDDANQLTSITYKKGTTTLGDLTYTYDKAGRRIKVGGSYARQNTPTATSTTAYNAANQQTNWKGITQTYDLNGNLTNDGSKTYTWNARNQLTNISGGGVTASFQYDALGRRIGKTINGTNTNFLYDGMNVIQELTGATPKANLIPGLNLDEVYSRTEGATTSYYLDDALNSTLALTDATGTIQTQYTYEPFGNTTQSGTANNNAFQYTGRENDGTGLYYYRARYYSAATQRFISQDPIGFRGGDVNLYAYVGNGPILYNDELGLAPESPDATKQLICYYATNFAWDPWAQAQLDRLENPSDLNLRNAEHFFWARDHLQGMVTPIGTAILGNLWSIGKVIRDNDPFQLYPTTTPSGQEWMWNQIGALADKGQNFCDENKCGMK